jgi:hypothetical protein
VHKKQSISNKDVGGGVLVVGRCPPGNIFIGPSSTNDITFVIIPDPVAIIPALNDIILTQDF